MLKNLLENKKTISFIIMAIVIAGGLVCIFSYSIGVNVYDKYDFFEDVLWAKATVESKSLLSPNFKYFYIVPFGANLLMAPFVCFLGPCLLANQLGMLLYYVIYLLVIFRLANLLLKDKSSQYIFIAVSSLFVFTYIGDNILHHILYYGIAYVCFVGEIGCCLSIKNNCKKVMDYILLVFFVLWASCNGIACFGISTAAIIFGLVASYIVENKKIDIFKDKDLTKQLTLVMSFSLIGLIIFYSINSSANTANFENVRMILTSIENVVNNLVNKLLRCYIEIFVTNNDNPAFFSFGFFSAMFSYLFFLIFTIFSIYSIKRIFKCKNEKELFIAFSSLFVLAVCLFMFIFSNENSERYLFNGLLSLFLIDAIQFEKLYSKNNHILRIISLVMAFALLIQSIASYKLVDRVYRNKEDNVINCLLENDLHYGYATEYHGVPMYVLSNGNLHFAYYHIDDSNEKIARDYAQNFVYNYNQPLSADKFFILLNDDDYDKFISFNVYEHCLDDYKCEDLHIVVFDIKYWDEI